jgi:ABC-type uncharacterized transport system
MAVEKRRIAGWASAVFASALALAAWLVVVLLASRPGIRQIIDLTPGHVASVRPGTEKLITELQRREGTRIEIYSFFEPLPSGRTPQERATVAIHRRVQNMTIDLLRQYAALGGEKLTVRHVNSRRNPDAAREILERFGGVKQLHVIVVAVVRDKEGGGETIQKKIIPVVDLSVIDFGSNAAGPGAKRMMPRLELFTGEEQLSSAMKTLLAGGTPTVYLIDGHREEMATKGDSPDDYTNLVAGLQAEGFKVSAINLNEKDIPQDATVLACLEPKTSFDQSECGKIHAWLKRGGRLFLNLSYHVVSTQNPKLEDLLGPIGARVGDRMVAQQWNNASPQKAKLLEIHPHNTALPITRELAAKKRIVGIREARPIFKTDKPVEGASLDQSLLRTERNCWLAGRVSSTETDFIWPRDAREYGSRCVGGVVTIQPDVGDHSGRVIIIGGVGFNNSNIDRGAQKDFVLNCFSWLAERTEHIRFDRDQAGPRKSGIITRSTNPDVVASKLARAFYLLVLGVPLSFFGLGLFVWWRRRRI